MPRHVYDPPRSGDPATAGREVARDPGSAAHDDLAVELPSWDLLPPAEFVRRRRTGG